MRAVAAVVVAAMLLGSRPAAAWDPFTERADGDPPRDAASAAPMPSGLYVVTDVYEGDVVVSSGATTVYSTVTVHQRPGTYARVVDIVGTGEASAFDGASFNGRARLPDGRLVAGTYYEDFVLTASGFVSVNIVFFQDDRITVPAARTPGPPPTVPAATPPATPTAAPSPAAAASPTPRAPVPTRRSPTIAAGIALGPTAPTLDAIEVLRARVVPLWPRAFQDGVPIPVRSWRLVSGTADLLSARAGTGDVPCEAAWLTLPPAGTALTLRFELTSDAAPGRVMSATIRVAVRSPALTN